MTEETRAELRRGIEAVVRVASLPLLDLRCHLANSGKYPQLSVLSHTWDEPPPLTTAQQLALSVLVGEPDRVVLSALCDLLIEQGHEYAVAVAEKARRDERRRLAGVIVKWVDSYSLRSRLLIEIDGRDIPGFATGGPDAEEPRT